MALKLSIPRDDVSGVSPPTLAAVAPDWVELTQRKLGFLAAKDALVARASELQKALNANANALWFEQNRRPDRAPPQPVKASDRAAALLGPKYTPAPRQPETIGQNEPLGIAEMRKVSGEIAAIDEALALLEPQLVRARIEGSDRLWAMLRPEYREIAGRICDALIDLGRAQLEHEKFLYMHRSAAIARLRPIHGTGSLGDPCDPASELRRMLQWACECGHFAAAKIPAAEWKRPAERESFARQ
jgi:hypothetical protein